MKFHLTKKAKEDLKDIAFYTHKIWGIEQRNFYIKQFDDAFKLIAKSPKIGRNCDGICLNYYKLSIGKHIIFYRFLNKEIQIVRILHENMDINNRLN